MTSQRKNEAGFVLIHAILFIAFLTTVVTVVTAPLLARAHSVRLHAQRVQALYAAEAGVAEALAILEAGGNATSTIRGTIAAARYEVTLARDGARAFIIRSTGTCGGRSHVEERTWAGGVADSPDLEGKGRLLVPPT